VKFKTLYGRTVSKNCFRYLIDWDKPSRSKIQFRVKQLLKPFWIAHIVFEEFPVVGTRLKIDFFNATRRLAIEFNGPQHDTFNPFFHNNSRTRFVDSMDRDCQKAKWLALNGIKLVEFIESDLKDLSSFYNKLDIEYKKG
jgi:hypothetical protein